MEFSLKSEHQTWFSLVVEDREGRKAYTNPIWIDPVEYPRPASK